MKRILLMAMVVMSSVVTAIANEPKSDTTNYNLSVAEQRDILMQTRHEFRLGSTFLSLSAISASGMYLSNGIGDVSVTPCVTLDYTYRVVEFLEVGAFLSHSSMAYDDIEMVDGDLSGTLVNRRRENLFSVAAYARYSWLNRRYVQLYSSFGVGLLVEADYVRSDDPSRDSGCTFSPFVAPEFVPIGVRFGGRFFGYFEPFAASMRGFLFNLGVGYRF